MLRSTAIFFEYWSVIFVPYSTVGIMYETIARGWERKEEEKQHENPSGGVLVPAYRT